MTRRFARAEASLNSRTTAEMAKINTLSNVPWTVTGKLGALEEASIVFVTFDSAHEWGVSCNARTPAPTAVVSFPVLTPNSIFFVSRYYVELRVEGSRARFISSHLHEKFVRQLHTKSTYCCDTFNVLKFGACSTI